MQLLLTAASIGGLIFLIVSFSASDVSTLKIQTMLLRLELYKRTVKMLRLQRQRSRKVKVLTGANRVVGWLNPLVLSNWIKPFTISLRALSQEKCARLAIRATARQEGIGPLGQDRLNITSSSCNFSFRRHPSVSSTKYTRPLHTAQPG